MNELDSDSARGLWKDGYPLGAGQLALKHYALTGKLTFAWSLEDLSKMIACSTMMRMYLPVAIQLCPDPERLAALIAIALELP